MTTKHPDIDGEIPQLCKETFVSKNQGMGILWIIAGLFLSMAGAAVGFAITTTGDLTAVKTESNINTAKLESIEKSIIDKLERMSTLEKSISEKLDALIKK